MELDVAFECENCQPGFKPETAYQLLGTPRGDKRKIKDKTRGKYYEVKILDGGFTELSLSDSPSPHRRSVPSRMVAANVEDGEVHKRGSVYHSSREIMKMRKQRGRKKSLEMVDNKETFLSFEIHSLSRSYQDEQILNPQQKRSPLISLNTEQKSSSSPTSQTVLINCNEGLDLSRLPEEQSDLKFLCSGSISPENCSAHAFQEATLKRRDDKFCCGNEVLEILENRLDEESEHQSNQILGSENDDNIYHETDAMFAFSKSFSAKAGALAALHSEKGYLKASTPWVSPLKKMFDPIMKSKSMRSPSLRETENVGCATTNPASIRKNMGLHKYLANEFASAAEKAVCDELPSGGGQVLNTGSSPAHLHGTVKLELKYGEPSFEFSMKDPDLQLSAKTWKTDNAFNWVYTFHRKKSSSMGWGAKDRHRQSSPIIGQMNVSCYLCSEMSDDSCLDNSMVTEFVLYDIALARRSFLEERCHCSSECLHVPSRTSANSLVVSCTLDANNSVEQEKCKRDVKHAFGDSDAVASAAYPWAPADLHPQLEIAAIVIEAPFGKREGSKAVQMDEIKNKEYPNKLSAPAVDLARDVLNASSDVKVVTPTTRHGLPNIEEGGPSSLLERWRSGGSCDCGGWDMGCPIAVFDNHTRDVANHSKHGTRESMMLFLQGKKEKVPALSMTADGKGVYLIQFHAQLSAIQAFSICIAMLHGSEPSITGEENRLKLYSNSLKLLLEEEVRNLVEAVAKEEKQTPTKKVEHIPPSFLLDPPFSPMGRV